MNVKRNYDTAITLAMNFDLRDQKGRTIGYTARIVPCVAVEGLGYDSLSKFEAGSSLYEVRCAPTRNGIGFGASQPPTFVATYLEAVEIYEQAAARSEARYAKQFREG